MDTKPKSNLTGRPNNKNTLFIVLIAVLVVVLIAGISVWALQAQNNDQTKKENDSRIKDLEEQADASKDKESSSDSSKKAESDREIAKPSASQKTISAILTASKTKDYSMLKPLFAEKMFVAQARADGAGYDTPDSTVVNILNNMGERAKQPWNFDVDTNTIQKNESYDQYINKDMYVGVSSDEKGGREVVSFKIGNDGKIQSIFFGSEKIMSPNR